jgi:hypothetical protein
MADVSILTSLKLCKSEIADRIDHLQPINEATLPKLDKSAQESTQLGI